MIIIVGQSGNSPAQKTERSFGSQITGFQAVAAIAARIDSTIGKRPGLAWFDRLTQLREESIARLGRTEPAFSPMIAAD